MRTRRIVKWVGLVLCVVIGAAWATSMYRGVSFYGAKMNLYVHAGSVELILDKWSTTWFSDTWNIHVYDATRDWRAIPFQYSNYSSWGVVIPAWIPLLLVAVPTFIAWRRDRKPPPGHCACGYNLTGNVSGRCPECGAHIEASP